MQVNGESVWHLDKYQSQSVLVFNMTNLGCLLENTEQVTQVFYVCNDGINVKV